MNRSKANTMVISMISVMRDRASLLMEYFSTLRLLCKIRGAAVLRVGAEPLLMVRLVFLVSKDYLPSASSQASYCSSYIS